jgi:hypothetical protein
MNTIGFVQFTSAGQKEAGAKLMENVRQFYPDAFYMVLADADESRLDDCIKYNAEYYYSQRKMGYPQEPGGYTLDKVLEFWERLYIACMRTNTTHLVYLEDDIKIVKPITFPEDTEATGQPPCYPDGNPFKNGFPDKFMEMIEEFSGVYPNVNGYGSEGGFIFKVSVFLDNYHRIVEWMKKNYDYIQQNVYVKMGWIDCFNTYFFLLAGAKYTHNPNLVNLFDPHGDNQWNYYGYYTYPNVYNVGTPIPDNVEILHHYKKYYKEQK